MSVPCARQPDGRACHAATPPADAGEHRATGGRGVRAGHMKIAPVPRAVKPTRCVSDQWERHHCCPTGSTAHWLLYTVRFHVTLSYVGSAGSKIATDADVACCHVRTPWRGCRSSARQSPREETAAAVTCGDDGRQAGAGRHAVRHYSGRACLCGRPRLIAGRGRLGGRGVCGGCDRRSPQRAMRGGPSSSDGCDCEQCVCPQYRG